MHGFLLKKVLNKKGIGLVEMIISLTLLFLVIAGSCQLFVFGMRNWKVIDNDSAVMQEVNLGLLRMGRDIRAAKTPNENVRPVEVLSAGGGFKDGQRLHVYTDDPNSDKMLQIHYYIEEGDLKRAVVLSDEDEFPYFIGTQDTSGVVWTKLISGIKDEADIFVMEERVGEERCFVKVSFENTLTSGPYKVETAVMTRSRRRVQ